VQSAHGGTLKIEEVVLAGIRHRVRAFLTSGSGQINAVHNFQGGMRYVMHDHEGFGLG
jgi:hypothetical protein